MTLLEPLQFHRLAFLDDGDEVVIGRSDIHSYGAFPADGAALVRELAAGRPLDEVADWYADTFGEPVDMDEFVATLHELQFVRVADEPIATAPMLVRYRRLGAALFSPVAWLLYGALLVAAVVATARDHALAPRTGNVFFTPSLVVVAASVLVGQVVLTGIHEAFHLLAGRRAGIDSRLRISRRFYMVVFETSLDGLAVVPRRQRYLPIMAGLVADAVAVCGLTVVAAATGGVVRGLALALAFTTLPRMAWQLYLFLRTDVYHLIATATGAVDLDTVARGLLANRANRLLRRPLRDDRGWHPRDVRLARFYAPLLVLGYCWMLATLAFVAVPLAVHFWRSPLLLVLTLAQLVAASVIAVRERRLTRRSPA